MRNWIAAGGALVGASLVVPAAGAKEIGAVEVCGASACREIGASAARAFGAGPYGTSSPVSEVPAASPQSYYVVRFYARDGRRLFEAFRSYFVAAPGLLRPEDERGQAQAWGRAGARQAAALRRATRGLDPYAPPRLTSVRVGAHPSREPAAYASLLGLRRLPGSPPTGRSIYITLHWRGRNPWSAQELFVYYPRQRILFGANGYVRVPEELAVGIEREAAGLPPTTPADPFPWATVALATGALALGVGPLGLVLASRRRRLAHARAVGLGTTFVTFALVLAGAAAAKEIASLQVCRPTGCRSVSPNAALRVASRRGLRLDSSRAPEPGSHYRVRIGYADERGRIVAHTRAWFVPGSGAWLADDESGGFAGWSQPAPRELARLRAAARGLKPFPAPEARAVFLGTHRAADPAPYLALLGPLAEVGLPRETESALVVQILWKHPNPWSVEGSLLSYLPRAHVLLRPDGRVRISPPLAERLRREAAGLPPVPAAAFPSSTTAASAGGTIAATFLEPGFVRRRAAGVRTLPT